MSLITLTRADYSHICVGTIYKITSALMLLLCDVLWSCLEWGSGPYTE